MDSLVNTVVELKMNQSRLKYLQERKEELFTRLIMPKAMTIDLIGGQNMPKDTDAVMKYVIEINSPGVNGLSMNDEIEQLTRRVNELTLLLSDLAQTMAGMQGIEYDLFYEIAVKGTKAKKAVQKVASMHYMSESNVWNVYYPKVKAEVLKVKEGRKND